MFFLFSSMPVDPCKYSTFVQLECLLPYTSHFLREVECVCLAPKYCVYICSMAALK